LQQISYHLIGDGEHAWRDDDRPGVQISPALVDPLTPTEQTTCGQPHEAQLVPTGLGGAP
jgi:hypothetical protein